MRGQRALRFAAYSMKTAGSGALIRALILLAENPSKSDDHTLLALVAQLDRVLGYEPRGQRFESSPVRFCIFFKN